MPGECSERLLVSLRISIIAIVSRRLLETAHLQRFIPLVIDGAVPLLEEQGAILVLHHESLMEPARRIIGINVHLPDADAMIALVGQRADPCGLPGLEVAE